MSESLSYSPEEEQDPIQSPSKESLDNSQNSIEEDNQEYLETLQQGLYKIGNYFNRLTWEVGLPDQDRLRMAKAIEHEAVEYLAAGIKHPQTNESVLKMFRNYCNEQSNTDLYPLITQLLTTEPHDQNNQDPDVSYKTALESLDVLKIIANSRYYPEDSKDDIKIQINEKLIPQIKAILPNVINNIEKDWRYDSSGIWAKSVTEYGDEDQNQKMRQAILDHIASNIESVTVLDAWRKQAENSDRLSHELEKLINEGLAQKGLDALNIIADWRSSSGGETVEGVSFDQPHINYSLVENFKTVLQLEDIRPGATTELRNEFSVKLPGRYPVKMLINQLENPPQEGDSFGIIVSPEADHNGAFLNHKDKYQQLSNGLAANQKAVIFEASNLLDLVSSFNKARHLYEDVGKISFAIIGGHGTSDSVRFGGQKFGEEYNQIEEKRSVLYYDDIYKPGAQAIKEVLDDNADIILISCETGDESGISYDISRNMSQSIVSAPNISTRLKSLQAYTKTNGKVGVKAEFDKNSTSRKVNGQELYPGEY